MIKFASFLILILIFGLIFSSCKRSPNPMTYVTYGSPISYSPPTVHNPWLCYISYTSLICQATLNVRYRRGQRETEFPVGYQMCWKNPQGMNSKALLYYGCPDDMPCDGEHILVSSTAKAEACDTPFLFKVGNDSEVPINGIGIAEVGIHNNQFSVISDRFTGLFAPHNLKAGSGVKISCTIDECIVSN